MWLWAGGSVCGGTEGGQSSSLCRPECNCRLTTALSISYWTLWHCWQVLTEVDWFMMFWDTSSLNQRCPRVTCGEPWPTFSALQAPQDSGYWNPPAGLSMIKSLCPSPVRWLNLFRFVLLQSLCVGLFSSHLFSQIVWACASPGSTPSSTISPRSWTLHRGSAVRRGFVHVTWKIMAAPADMWRLETPWILWTCKRGLDHSGGRRQLPLNWKCS